MSQNKDLKKLLRLCTPTLAAALLRSVKEAAIRHHERADFEHLLNAMLTGQPCDIHAVFDYYDISIEKIKFRLRRTLGGFPKTTSTGSPALNPTLITTLEIAWSHSKKWHQKKIRTGNVLFSHLSRSEEVDSLLMRLLRPIDIAELQSDFPSVVENSSENKEAEIQRITKEKGSRDSLSEISRESIGDAISKYCRDLTELARNNQIDPVFGRDIEVQKVLDVLARRKKNNPILVGEPGVGKTAIVNGLAHRIVQHDVPKSFQNARLVEVDLGLLQAGASVKGEFENRLKSLIDEVRTSPQLTILFIDEAHNLIGAGGTSGAGDAANLLKPALAAGELRSVAATTWSEYHKYIEKDPALERRFQPILVTEPSPEDSLKILRGARESYEKNFGVRILDEALMAAVDFGNRYIAGRFLPDVAFDLIDTAGAKIKNIMESKPSGIDLMERELVDLKSTVAALKRESLEGRSGAEEEILEKQKQIESIQDRLKANIMQWEKERELIENLNQVREELLARNKDLEVAGASESETADVPLEEIASEIRILESRSRSLTDELKAVQAENPLLQTEVDAKIVAQVVSDLTGIPTDRITSEKTGLIRTLPGKLKNLIKGQDHAIDAVTDALANYQAGINNPDAPIGVFLLLGPSGTGKTYLAELIAQFVFGGTHHVCKINMSEYSESHTVSRLIGSPPGYVGYGEGGVLTEAVRQRPFSVVLLDEVEKAARQVWELFYEVFDRGAMRDGEGKPINFRNTMIFLTSNVGDQLLLDWFEKNNRSVPVDKIPLLSKSVRQFAEQVFPVPLLNRMKVIPFLPLEADSMQRIINLKLNSLRKRIREQRQLAVNWTEDYVSYLLSRCESVNVGARLIDQLIEKELLPKMAKTILAAQGSDLFLDSIIIDMTDSESVAVRMTASKQVDNQPG